MPTRKSISAKPVIVNEKNMMAVELPRVIVRSSTPIVYTCYVGTTGGAFVCKMSDMVYLDHNATTPMTAEVYSAMVPYLREQWGNAASRNHRLGRASADAVE